MNWWLIPFALILLAGILILIDEATAKPLPPTPISDEQHREQLAELRKGIMPCRFCGLDYFWTDNRHDPLKMAGVHTLAGQGRHWARGRDALLEHVRREMTNAERRAYRRVAR